MCHCVRRGGNYEMLHYHGCIVGKVPQFHDGTISFFMNGTKAESENNGQYPQIADIEVVTRVRTGLRA